ncbi:MAG: hypothetical protein KY461_11330 [Actinobacteria bacterium]|nr:hypothetical protein [Actinomycetota bacterium]
MHTILRRALAGLLALALVLVGVACDRASGPERSWRDLEVTLPEGWSVFEDEGTRFSVADGTLGDDGDRGTAEAAAFFTHEPGSGPDAWRELVDGALDGTLERDERLQVGGVPATRLVFSHESNGLPLREMVVLVPSRELVILMQPIVLRGERDGPQVFDAHLAEFDALLSSLRFGAPTDRQGQ